MAENSHFRMALVAPFAFDRGVVVGEARLRVTDLHRAVRFYREVLALIGSDGDLADFTRSYLRDSIQQAGDERDQVLERIAWGD